MTHRSDCNTVGPVLVASGYGSSMLTHSAAYVLRDSNTHASSLQRCASSPIRDRAPVAESIDNGTRITTFTGSDPYLAKEGVLQRRNPIEGVTKITSFT